MDGRREEGTSVSGEDNEVPTNDIDSRWGARARDGRSIALFSLSKETG